jgi:hypothetical protein
MIDITELSLKCLKYGGRHLFYWNYQSWNKYDEKEQRFQAHLVNKRESVNVQTLIVYLAEENIWTEEGWSSTMLEKTA